MRGDLPSIAPNLDLFLWGPVINEMHLCTYRELCDGTYGIDDLMDFHEAINLINEVTSYGDN